MTVPIFFPYSFINGTVADANQVNGDFNAVATAFGLAAAAGANADITSLTGLTTPIAPTAGGSSVFLGGTSTGTANAQVVSSPTPSGFTLTQNYSIIFTVGITNTGATTLAVNGTTATNVYKGSQLGPVPLDEGDLTAGNLAMATFDGTEYQLIGTNLQLGGFGPSTSIASATTTDLGTIGSHYASITGTTTITSFGVSGTTLASTAYPFYRVAFAGALTLTYNATSMILPGGVNILTAAGDTADVVYGGGGNWAVIRYQRAALSPSAGALPGANGLVITNNAAQSVTVAFNSAVMVNSSGYPIYSGSQSLTVNLSTSGSSTGNDLDTGTMAATTWYYIYAISNGVTVAGLASASSTSPSLPSGYTYQVYLGAVRSVTNTTLRTSRQLGNEVQYVVSASLTGLPELASGVQGSITVPTWVSQSVSNFVPSTATKISLVMFANILGNSANSSGFIIAPNNLYGAINSSTNPPPLSYSIFTGQLSGTFKGVILLETAAIYFATNVAAANGGLFVAGWIDAVNAN